MVLKAIRSKVLLLSLYVGSASAFVIKKRIDTTIINCFIEKTHFGDLQDQIYPDLVRNGCFFFKDIRNISLNLLLYRLMAANHLARAELLLRVGADLSMVMIICALFDIDHLIKNDSMGTLEARITSDKIPK